MTPVLAAVVVLGALLLTAEAIAALGRYRRPHAYCWPRPRPWHLAHVGTHTARYAQLNYIPHHARRTA